MKKQTQYKTKQKELIVDYLAALSDNHTTVNQIQAHFIKEEIPIGLTTIYRCLESLVENGLVRKYMLDPASGACFQYVGETKHCDEHFHLKCEKCGELIHLECSFLGEIAPHIMKKHHFQLNTAKTVFYGLCEHCNSK